MRWVDSRAYRGVLLTLLAGQVFRVEQRAARPLPERRPAKFRRALFSSWSKVADARNHRGKRPRSSGTRASHVLGAKGAVSFPKQDALE
jgi:hypothetical protein